MNARGDGYIGGIAGLEDLRIAVAGVEVWGGGGEGFIEGGLRLGGRGGFF